MKRLLPALAILLILPAAASAEILYVTQNGGSGAMSVDHFNNPSYWGTGTGKISPGDTVYFSGKFTTGISVQGSGTDSAHIKLDGYSPDDTRYMGLSEATGRALFDMNQASGNTAIRIDGKNYIDVVDFEFTDLNTAVSIDLGSMYITVQRCYGHTLSRNLVYIGSGTSGVTVGGSPDNGCVAKNVGQDTAGADIVTTNTDNLIVSYNHLYANTNDYGTDGVTLHSTNDVLIEYNSIHSHNDAVGEWGENGIDIKQDSYNIIIRYNEIYDHNYESGIILNGRTEPPQSADQVYIYGNLFYGGDAPGVHSQSNAGEYYDDVYIFSNIFHDMDHRALSLSENGNYNIYNNIFAECSITGDNSYDAGVYIAGSTAVLKNNIYYKNRPNDASHLQFSVSNYHDVYTISDNNRYYWPGQTSTFRWGDAGTYISLSQIQNGNTQGLPQEAHGSEGDPGLVDIDGNDYRINSASSAVSEAGVDMGSGAIATLTIQGEQYPVYWDMGLGPNTDWSGTTPVIEEARRDEFGWDQGAYVYTGGVTQTCSSLGYFCCPTESTCSDPRTGPGCSGTCCASSSQCTANPGCGDGTCDAVSGECSICPQDCTLADCQNSGTCDLGLTDGSENCQDDPDDCGSCPTGDICDGLSALWRLDGSADDSSPNSNDGTLSGPSPASGIFSGAYSFDGSNDYISVSPDDTLSSISLTLSAWVYLPGLIQSDWRTVLEHDRGGSDWYGLYKSSTGNRFHFRWSGSGTSDFSSTISPDTWYHVVGTYDASTGIATMYLDGVLDGQASGSAPTEHNGNLMIGMNNDGGEAISAVIDEVAIWDRSLTASEIQSLQGGPLTCGQPQDTCQSTGGSCCSACFPGTERPAYDADCPGVCCGSCYQPGQDFLPGVPVEAEAGTLTFPMETGSDSQSSGGSYIQTTTRDQGSADYVFDITIPGDYYIEASIIAPTIQNDSFFVGLDGEPAGGNDDYAWDTPEFISWTWVNVTRRGAGGGPSNNLFDPMVWTLSSGQHTFTIYGREEYTLLDRFILRPIYVESHRADTSGDGCVDPAELNAFINLWYLDSTEYQIGELMEAVGLWKAGTGCPSS